MKNSFLLICSICILSGMLSSCEDEGNETYPYQCPDITGEWEWKKFVGAFGDPVITPDSLGISKSLIIDDSTFSVLINDTLTTSTTYACNPISNSHFTLLSIKLGTGEIYVPNIHHDTLVLGDVFNAEKDIYWRK